MLRPRARQAGKGRWQRKNVNKRILKFLEKWIPTLLRTQGRTCPVAWVDYYLFIKWEQFFPDGMD